MRLIRFQDASGQPRYAYELQDGQVELLEGDPFDPGNPLQPAGKAPKPSTLLAPLRPANIYCIGANYLEHIKESGVQPPPRPVVFMKGLNALNHPGSPIRVPKCQMTGPETDYECELAVVIGRPALNIPRSKALDYVFGYTAANDVSARRWQKDGGLGQWIRGKGFDTFCPLGPAIVTADEIPDPQNLTLSTTLNGQQMQHGHTSDMLFKVDQLIEFLTQDTTLQPGTIILTGTPVGVGFARKPPVFLQPGDTVTVEVEKIGKLTNPVIAAP